jgi:hypothetical protein
MNNGSSVGMHEGNGLRLAHLACYGQVTHWAPLVPHGFDIGIGNCQWCVKVVVLM